MKKQLGQFALITFAFIISTSIIAQKKIIYAKVPKSDNTSFPDVIRKNKTNPNNITFE